MVQLRAACAHPARLLTGMAGRLDVEPLNWEGSALKWN